MIAKIEIDGVKSFERFSLSLRRLGAFRAFEERLRQALRELRYLPR